MLKKGLRLRKKEDFEKVFRFGKPLFFGEEIGCRYLKNESPFQIGFSFSKKHIPIAAKRNRLRRVIAAALSRRNAEQPEKGYMVFFCLKKPKKADIENIDSVMEKILGNIKKKP